MGPYLAAVRNYLVISNLVASAQIGRRGAKDSGPPPSPSAELGGYIRLV